MIITDVTQGWSSKTNFTDENDVFVGFDTEQDCCEDAGYFITEKEDSSYPFCNDTTEDVVGYTFDTDYFVGVIPSDALDAGGQVRFKLVHPTKEPLYLNLYNCHNGYYGHGFDANIKGQLWQEDVL